MRKLIFMVLITGCTNEPQYVSCAPMGAAAMDLCKLEGGMDDGMGGTLDEVKGSVHIPLRREEDWKQSDQDKRTELMANAPAGVDVPIYRPEHYDISVEWTVKNLTDQQSQFRVDLNGANEEFTYDPSMIILDPTDDEAPPTPPLAGNIPIDIGPNAEISGTFREDQLVEAAIDLDQVTRGNVNPFRAVLTTSRHDDQFQPVTPYDYVNMTGGEPTGPAVPSYAWRQIVRVDIVFKPQAHMTIDYTVRVREHVDVIPDEGLNDPDINVLDPAPYVP
ncbi:MAG TPA: hypothetical protein VFV99_12900 [Kofleriaceae bacterium]|nr:hypothetical protein [Kofleriaceae bacterium]